MLLACVDPSTDQSGRRRNSQQNADHTPPEPEVASLGTPPCHRVFESSGCEHQPEEANHETEDATHVVCLLKWRRRTLRAAANVSEDEGQATVSPPVPRKTGAQPAPRRAMGPSLGARGAGTPSGSVRIGG